MHMLTEMHILREKNLSLQNALAQQSDHSSVLEGRLKTAKDKYKLTKT